ncbi:hypothetical protein SLS62_011130 [Diatrype stigma]|uniref:DC-UbP/UBTD2 N-terminal domain-containing protein n=1 Tax=Diatrype stigma TaxID=117547 RepID=A0AAN9UDS9_9PEZI
MAGPNAPYPGGPSPSARAINSPPLPVRQSSATEDSIGAESAAPPVAAATVIAVPAGARAGSLSQHDEDARSNPRSHSNRRHSRLHHNHHHDREHSEQPPLSQHIDKPLRRHRWASKRRAWTRTALDTERADFFDTRVTGRQEVWQVLRAALEVLWEADLRRAARHDDDDGRTALTAIPSTGGGDGDVDGQEVVLDQQEQEREDESLATAQTILSAAEVTLPTGDLANGAYDALGNYYALPEWIVSDPANVAEDSGARSAAGAGNGTDNANPNDDDNDLVDEDAALRRREEKGKAVANVRNMVKVCARLSENGRDVIVRASAEESVRSVARKVVEDSGVSWFLSFRCLALELS